MEGVQIHYGVHPLGSLPSNRNVICFQVLMTTCGTGPHNGRAKQNEDREETVKRHSPTDLSKHLSTFKFQKALTWETDVTCHKSEKE